MRLTEMDQLRITRDITRKVEACKAPLVPNRAMCILRQFGLSNATICSALGLTEGVVASWATGSKSVPSERQAELDMLVRGTLRIMATAPDLPHETFDVLGDSYAQAKEYVHA